MLATMVNTPKYKAGNLKIRNNAKGPTRNPLKDSKGGLLCIDIKFKRHALSDKIPRIISFATFSILFNPSEKRASLKRDPFVKKK